MKAATSGRNVLLITLALLLVGARAFAFEWGGSITNSSQYETQEEGSDEDEFFQSNTLSLYMSTPVGQWSQFAADAAYTYTTDRAVLLNLREAHFTRTVQPENGPARFISRLGRFNAADPTGQILRHPLDGIRLQVAYPGLELRLTAGYTGFLLQPAATVSLTRLDQADDEDDVFFAPSRLVGQLSATLPELFLGQSVQGALLFQEDLRDPTSDDLIEPGVDTADPTRGGLLDTQYALLSVSGPIQGNFFYDVYGILNTGRTLSFIDDDDSDTGEVYEYKPILAGLFGLRLNYFMPDVLGSRASLYGRLGTGDSDYGSYTEGNSSGKATQFTPITASPAGQVFGIESGNSAHIGVSYRVRPFSTAESGWLKRLQGELATYSFFRTTGKGVTSVSAIDTTSSERYLGSEFDFSLRARPYSDLGIGLTTGLFVANTNAIVDGANEVDFLVRLDASLSF